MKKLTNLLALIGGLLGVFGAMFGSYTYIDGRYALASEVEKLEKRLTLKELKDLYKGALSNLYFFRKQARLYPRDQELLEMLKISEDECELLKKQILELTKRSD